MFGFGIYDVFIIAAFLGIQYFLSTRNNAYWGVVVPIIFASWLTWYFRAGGIDKLLAYILILIIGLLFLFEQWNLGRKSLKKKREKELVKMQSHDLQ